MRIGPRERRNVKQRGRVENKLKKRDTLRPCFETCSNVSHWGRCFEFQYKTLRRATKAKTSLGQVLDFFKHSDSKRCKLCTFKVQTKTHKRIYFHNLQGWVEIVEVGSETVGKEKEANGNRQTIDKAQEKAFPSAATHLDCSWLGPILGFPKLCKYTDHLEGYEENQ